MHAIGEFVDLRQHSWCIHCGGWIAGLETNVDHVPSRSLLLEPYPPELPVVRVCKKCNGGFSLDEEYLIAFLGSVLAGTTDPERQSIPRAARILRRSPKLRASIERSRAEHQTQGGETRVLWRPEQERVDRVLLKNARGHAFFEYGEPMLDAPEYVRSFPLESLTAGQREEFEMIEPGPGWPEVGSRMLTRVVTGADLAGGWVVVQDGVYRYAVAQDGGMTVRAVLFEYIATEVRWSA